MKQWILLGIVAQFKQFLTLFKYFGHLNDFRKYVIIISVNAIEPTQKFKLLRSCLKCPWEKRFYIDFYILTPRWSKRCFSQNMTLSWIIKFYFIRYHKYMIYEWNVPWTVSRLIKFEKCNKCHRKDKKKSLRNIEFELFQ